MGDSDSLAYKLAFAATLQGDISYTIFSLYVLNPETFRYYLGGDPGAILFASMLYGNGVHIYSRRAMKRLRGIYRIRFSIHGSYMFNISSLLIFLGIAVTFDERRVLGTFLSYFTGRFMCALFYSFLYFVDTCADPTASIPSLDFMLSEGQ